MNLRKLLRNFAKTDYWLPPPDLTSDEQKNYVDKALTAVWARLELLKAQVDVEGRRR